MKRLPCPLSLALQPLPAGLLLLVFLLPALLLSLPAAAAGLLRGPAPRVALEVVDREDGRVLPRYPHRGEDWLPGQPGHRYAVRLRNLGPQRVLVVLSVDGINAVSGQTADTRQPGYVLGPWQALDVDGWRKSLDAVAGFVFVDPADSYATRTGRPDNIGVIGIAVFGERAVPPPAGIAGGRAEAKAEQRARAASVPASAESADGYGTAAGHGQPAAPGLGTGHGRVEAAPAYATSFDRKPRPSQVTQLRYDTLPSLRARGIAASTAWRRDDPPRAFPGFVPDPPCCEDWR